MTTVVIGGGLAGLYLVSELSKRGDVVCLEASDRCGGRIRSVYDDKDVLLYESGPWRVPETHRRARRLFRRHGVPLGPLRTPTLPKVTMPSVVAGLSVWDVNALRSGSPHEADRRDLATGYADQTHCASGSAPYTTGATRYFVAPDGFSSLVETMARDHDVRYDHRVVDVHSEADGTYVLTVVRRDGHNSFTTTRMTASVLFVCVPPDACRDWDIFRKHATSVMCAVEPGELHHIYVKHRMPRCVHHREPASLLSQSVSSEYDNDWFQASYSGGRVARMWHNLSLSYPRVFTTRLAMEVSKLWKRRVSAEETRSHFWNVAFHHWRPVPNFDVQRAVRAAVCPSPHHLPNVYIAGEAFSSHQAWMEGALETAELALNAHLSQRGSLVPPSSIKGGPHVYVEGHLLHVKEWAKVHPGGEHALRNHHGEDVTDLMKHIHHSPHAWAVVHSLKRPL